MMMMDTKLVGMCGIAGSGLHHPGGLSGGGLVGGGRYTPPPTPVAYLHPASQHPAPDTMRRIAAAAAASVAVSVGSNHNTTSPNNIYGSLEDNLLARAEALAASDINKSTSSNNLVRADGLFGHADMPPHNPNMPPSRGGNGSQMTLSGFGPPPSTVGESMLEQLTNVHMPMGGIAPDGHNGFGISVSHHGAPHTAQMYPMNSYSHHASQMTMTMTMAAAAANNISNISNNILNNGLISPGGSSSGGGGGGGGLTQQPNPHHTHQHQQLQHTQQQHHQQAQQHGMNISPPLQAPTQSQQQQQQQQQPNASMSPTANPHSQHPEMDSDPRELEAFAEHFKQRRIKLGVTQADVGNALGKLKIPGVGSLSQSTICRFESLTLSHNNMIALKPVLQTWLEDAELASQQATAAHEAYTNGDKKRKRTSIAAPEKRSLEAYFAIQPRPSGEKIAQIAEKLDLKKNVVRVWFCNQRQKQKRMKFSAGTLQGQHSPISNH